MILLADAFDKGSCPDVVSPFFFSMNIFCPDIVPGLKLTVNGFYFQMTNGAATACSPAPAAAMFMLGWSRSGKIGGADELLRRFLDINI